MFWGNRLDGHCDIGFLFPMVASHLRVVHAVEVISSQYEHILCSRRADLKQLLANGICRALVPFLLGHGLLGSPDLHPAAMEGIEVIRTRDVSV